MYVGSYFPKIVTVSAMSVLMSLYMPDVTIQGPRLLPGWSAETVNGQYILSVDPILYYIH